MKPGRWRRTDGVAVWLVAASLCVLAGHCPVRSSGAADRETLAALSNPLPATSSPSSSSSTGTGSDLFVPVILTASGASSSYYTSELTLTNRGSQAAPLRYTYAAAAGGGNGAASETLAPGRQKIVPNAIDYLRSLGVPIPASGNRIGTLRVGVSGSAEVSVTVRTTTQVADGRAGLAYPAVAVADGFTEAVYLCGLRQNRQDRSNVAFQNMGNSGNIILRTTVYSGDPAAPGSRVMRDVTLAPGGFRQLNGLLATAGFTQGYAKVERVSGTAPFYAYGVINDQANSDGSFVFPVTESSLEGVRGLTLPVVIEHPNFTTELIVTNFSNSIKSFDVHFVADAIATPDKTATLAGNLIPPGGQAIIPDAVQMLRQSGAEGIGPRGRTIAGAAFFTAPAGDLSGVVIGARTGSPGGGGQYSVFYNAVPYGAAFDETAWIDALQQNRENRSNLALVNTGEVDGSPSVFQLDLYDGETGQRVNTVTGLRVAARGWRQINGILGNYAPGTTQGYVRVRKTAGNNPFLAYGVINDGGAPGERSGDGAYLPANGTRKRTDDPGGALAADRAALVALYEATNGPNWVNNAKWLTDAPVEQWYGVATDGSGRVTSLALPGNGLSGAIPLVLGELGSLEHLDLGVRWDEASQERHNNQLSGTIPPELGQLLQLRFLNLELNQLSGTIPPELARLSKLQHLFLAGNGLIGVIPPELGRLSQLTGLGLGYNRLTGTIPPELGQLSQLQLLNIASNGLIGVIPPEFGRLSQLTRLQLGYNQLTGTIPPELGQLSQLRLLSLSRNQLSGTIPPELARLSQLQWLYLSGNQLGGAIPPELLHLMNLQALYFARNDGLCAPGTSAFIAWLDAIENTDDKILFCNEPDVAVLEALHESTGGGNWTRSDGWLNGAVHDWYGVSADSLGRVTRLDLSSNGLSGKLSEGLGNLSQMTELRLGDNPALSGHLPPGLANLPLRTLHYDRTSLCAPDEAAFKRWLNSIPSHEGTGVECTLPPSDREILEALYHTADGPNWVNNRNWLSEAPLSEWFGVETDGTGRVTWLKLEGNQLSGTIPPALGSLTQLQELNLGGRWDEALQEQLNNKLSGTIPPELGGLTQLQRLMLDGNELNGTIPPEIGRLSQLTRLRLGYNQLTGTIPPELGQLSQLRSLSLSRNQLSGTIPPELARQAQLQWLYLGDNQLSGTIPPELGQLSQLQYLNLASNGLSGVIPPEIGRLSQLTRLRLGYNQLTGTIPPELGQLSQLRSLSLSRNQLSGTIPPELARLSQLQWLNLLGNQLGGAIPPELLNLMNLQALFFAWNDGICAPGTSAFIAWLGAIENTDDKILFCNESDVAVLEALHESTNGEDWTRSDGWLDGALSDWFGVSADPLGRVTRLDLSGNGLSGKLPAGLGNLSQLTELRLGDNRALSGRLPLGLANLALRTFHYDRTSLCAPGGAAFNRWLNGIPSHNGTGVGCALPPSDREILEALYHTTDGENWIRRDNWLTGAPLGEWHGVTTDGHGRVARLELGRNQLSGPIPAEFGGLANLTYLVLEDNSLNGPIPTQFGGLAKLEELWASESGFSGPIPPELGNLVNLEILQLWNNGLSGSIPPELGSLSNLRVIGLGGNDLTGPIPPELGDLSGLYALWLHDNDLTGPLLPKLGNLENLNTLTLDHNDLTGPVPPEFRRLSLLRALGLTGNAGLSGVLPPGLTDLRELSRLAAEGTGLCAPSDARFLDWLEGVRERRVPLCEAEPAMAYLIQSVQSRQFPVPLVAGERALLRVFVTARQASGEGIPDVRARFYRNDREVHVENIPGTLVPIPTEVDESNLSKSANAEIPSDLVQPGLEMVIEIDPEGMINPALGVAKRIPETGRLAIEVRSMPLFDLTIVPFLWTEEPDSEILAEVEAVVADPDGHPSFSRTRALVPVGDFEVTAHDPVESSSNNAYDLLHQTEAIWAMEGRRGHYMGTMSGPVTGGVSGVAYIGGRASFSLIPGPTLHELGHSMSLGHAPCGDAGGPDPSFPTTDASIGVWGFDFRTGGLVPSTLKDMMSYCGPDWISDFHFTNALRYRLFDEGATRAASVAFPARSLLLWGGVGADSIPFLEPAFVVDAPAALPDSAGPYRLTGHSGDGAELFSLNFTVPEVAHGDGRSGFAFVLPVRAGWEQSLVGITLSGPGGLATLDENTNRPMAILRDSQSGRVRGFLRNQPPAVQVGRDGAQISRIRGLEVIRSRGLPDAAAWQR